MAQLTDKTKQVAGWEVGTCFSESTDTVLNLRVQLEETYDVGDNDEDECDSGGLLTPKQARRLAAALVEFADFVEKVQQEGD